MTEQDERAYAAFKATWYGQNIGRIMTTGTRAEHTWPEQTWLKPEPIKHNDVHYWTYYQPAEPKPKHTWPFAARFLLGTIASILILRILLVALGGIYGYGLYAHWWH